MSLEVKILHTRSWFAKAAAGIKAAEMLLPDDDLVDKSPFNASSQSKNPSKDFAFGMIWISARRMILICFPRTAS